MESPDVIARQLNNKIGCIKAVRLATGCDLKTAKNAVERNIPANRFGPGKGHVETVLDSINDRISTIEQLILQIDGRL